ncbi:MAG: N-acetyltransferase family protein [Haloarcula sp.]
MNELEARARKRGFDRAEPDTSTDQTAAIAFYKQHGYERVGREYVDPAEMTLVFYEKNL